ncbi:MAG: hypothetical protein F4015_06065 [Acidimicrobiia bacterium]|nr:hypothetical protein [Acidimicrobiia bacterium]
MSLFTMPLARFLYGNTHKWYFRTAAAVLVASYVSAVQTSVEPGHRVWPYYLTAFGVVSFVYWMLYAPAKWSEKDYLVEEVNFGVELEPFPGELDEWLNSADIRSIVFADGVSDRHSLPSEIMVLSSYVHRRGRTERKGDYLRERQWRPPNHWRGMQEYNLLRSHLDSMNWEFAEGNALLNLEEERSRNHSYVGSTFRVLEVAAYLDAISPRWRESAVRWSRGGYRGILAAWARESARKLFRLGAARRDAGNSLLKVEERP